MKIAADISEDEMIATFLKGEIGSFRFGERIRHRLTADKQDRRVIDNPNISDAAENKYRRSLFGKYRGYGHNTDLFENFPKNIAWKRVMLDENDLRKLKYINYDYWVELSSGSRRVVDGAKNVVAGVEVFRQSNRNFWEAANIVERGGRFPEPILVAENADSPLVVLEGHVRLTAYLMNSEYTPKALSVIVGFSENMGEWDLY